MIIPKTLYYSLCDNSFYAISASMQQYLYEILVMTGQGAECSTHSKISFILSGENDETDVRTFGDQKYLKRRVFQSAQFDNFVMAVPRYYHTAHIRLLSANNIFSCVCWVHMLFVIILFMNPTIMYSIFEIVHKTMKKFFRTFLGELGLNDQILNNWLRKTLSNMRLDAY